MSFLTNMFGIEIIREMRFHKNFNDWILNRSSNQGIATAAALLKLESTKSRIFLTLVTVYDVDHFKADKTLNSIPLNQTNF